jgi:glycosyltransferase involved in cell wall biosynthesis
LTVRFLASLSGILPAQIVCNSVKAQDIHIKKGYRADKIVVIPNGFDLNMFRPDPLCRTSVRMELAVPEEAPLIGMVARFDPQKDHLTFIRAAKHLTQRYRKAQFLLCGDGVTWDNRALCEPIEALGLKKYFHLLGQRGDIPRLMASLDVFTLTSSSGESFPNVVGEAMACGVPCVATDIGDSAQIMGDTGKIVRSGDALAIAAGWEELLFLSAAARLRIGKELRRRIEENYSLPDIAKRYESLYATL